MTWAAHLDDFLSLGGDKAYVAYCRLVACLWDQGRISADAAAATPMLIRSMTQATTPEIRVARIALLLGLLAEGCDEETDQNHASARAAVRLGIPKYLEIMASNAGSTLKLALTYLLAHFHEDGASILAHPSLQGSAGASIRARLERILQFQESSRGDLVGYAKRFVQEEAAPPDRAQSQIRASILAPLGAEAQFAIESAQQK